MNDGVTGAHENAKYQGVSKLQPVSSDSAPSINQPTLTRAASLRTATADIVITTASIHTWAHRAMCSKPAWKNYNTSGHRYTLSSFAAVCLSDKGRVERNWICSERMITVCVVPPFPAIHIPTVVFQVTMDADIKDLVTDESFIGKSSEVTVDIRRPVGAGGIGTVYFGTFRHKAAAVKVVDRKKHSAMDLKALIGGDIRAARDLHSPMHVATVCAFVAVPPDESIAKKLGVPPTPEVWLVMEHKGR